VPSRRFGLKRINIHNDVTYTPSLAFHLAGYNNVLGRWTTAMNQNSISTHQSGVIVTDGNERSALAVTRSLGRRGIPVFVGAETSSSLAGVSRFAMNRLCILIPGQSGRVSGVLLERAKRWGARVVFPITDLAVEILGNPSSVPERPSFCRFLLWINTGRSQINTTDGVGEAPRVPIPDTIFVPDGDVEKALPQINRWPSWSSRVDRSSRHGALAEDISPVRTRCR